MARPHRLLFFDVESSFMMTPVWKAHDNYVAPERLKHDTHLLTWAAKWNDAPQVYYGRLTHAEAVARDDRRIVASLAWLLRQADHVVAHNGDRFDIPLVNGRLLQHGLESVTGLRSIDTLKMARRSFKVASNKLDYLAQLLGLGQKLPTSFELWERCYLGDETALQTMDAYCREDVRLLERVFHRIAPFSTGMPRLVSADVPDEFVCTRCGSTNLQKRGVYRTNASEFQRYRCNDCGRWDREAKADPAAKLALRPIH